MNESLTSALDALGKEIHIGCEYGYSRNQNGRSYITRGIAVKITKTGRVTLEEVKTNSFLYGEPLDPTDWYQPRSATNVSINSFMLFPTNGGY